MRARTTWLLAAAALLASCPGAWALPVAPVHYAVAARTPLVMTLTGRLVVGGQPAGSGVELAVRDPQGVLCGASGVDAVNGGAFILHVYGDDPTTAQDEGASPGDLLSLEVYDPTGQAGPAVYASLHFPPAPFGVPLPVAGSAPAFADREGYSVDVWVNRPPALDAIGNHAVPEGTTLTLAVDATDPDVGSNVADALSFAAADVPPGALFDPATRTFTWTPTLAQAGNYAVIFSVTDAGLPPLSDAETITVSVGDVNRPPVLDPVGDRVVAEGQTLAFNLSASDPDGDALVFDIADRPPGAVLDPATGAFSWTPATGSAGSYTTSFAVTDTGSPPLSDAETVTITVGGGNRPPVLATIGSQSVAEGALLSFSVSATDPDADGLTYSVVEPLPAGAIFDAATRTFTWIPAFGQAGTYAVTFRATDDGSPPLSDSETVTVTVGDVNRPPVLAAIGNRTADEGTLLTFTVAATDPDGDPLTFSAPQLPPGAAFDPISRVFAWVPDPGQAGNHGATFAVTDAGSPPLTDTEAIVITVGGGNRPPEIAPIGDRSSTEGTPLAFTVTASDPDGDTITWSATGLPAGASFDPAAQRFSWVPAVGDAGSYAVTFTATDNGSPRLSDQETITIAVQPLAARPAPEAANSGGGGGGGCFVGALGF